MSNISTTDNFEECLMLRVEVQKMCADYKAIRVQYLELGGEEDCEKKFETKIARFISLVYMCETEKCNVSELLKKKKESGR